MAKGRKTGGKDFELGKPGGPGRPSLPEDLRTAKKLTQTEFEKIMTKYLLMPASEFQEMTDAISNKQKTDASMLEMMLASVMQKAVIGGCPQRLEFILTRMFGKPKEKPDQDDQDEADELLREIPTEKLLLLVGKDGRN
jgi:hypothetical protein